MQHYYKNSNLIFLNNYITQLEFLFIVCETLNKGDSMKCSRRSALVGLGGLIVGSLATTALHKSNSKTEGVKATPATDAGKPKRFEQIGGDFSWKPQILDIDEVEKVAHQGFHHKGYG